MGADGTPPPARSTHGFGAVYKERTKRRCAPPDRFMAPGPTVVHACIQQDPRCGILLKGSTSKFLEVRDTQLVLKNGEKLEGKGLFTTGGGVEGTVVGTYGCVVNCNRCATCLKKLVLMRVVCYLYFCVCFFCSCAW